MTSQILNKHSLYIAASHSVVRLQFFGQALQLALRISIDSDVAEPRIRNGIGKRDAPADGEIPNLDHGVR